MIERFAPVGHSPGLGERVEALQIVWGQLQPDADSRGRNAAGHEHEAGGR